MAFTLAHYFFAFSLAVGVAVGAALVEFPTLQTLNLPSYLLILIALAAFDVACFLRGGSTTSGMVSMPVRFSGFIIALGAMMAVASLGGATVNFF